MARVRKGDDFDVPLTDEQLAHCRSILEDKKKRLVASIDESEDGPGSADRISDEVDLASAEYEAAFENRLRDRDKFLIRKIEKVLARFDEGEYDECESCGVYIGYKRLCARPETTLCIVCKEEQEKVERMYQKKRLQRVTYEL